MKKEKFKEKLEKRLKREAKPNELVNMETDTHLCVEVLQDEVDELTAQVVDLDKRLSKLEEK